MLLIRRYDRSGRMFTFVELGTMNIDQKRLKIGLKEDVVKRAAQSATLPEFRETYPAHGTGFLIEFRKLLCSLIQFQLFGQHPRQGRICFGIRIATRQITSRMIFAQMYDTWSAGVGQLRDMERGRLLAVLTFHKSILVDSTSAHRAALYSMVDHLQDLP